jgi:hypothetical protein
MRSLKGEAMPHEPELFSTSGTHDDDAHWDALAARITDRAISDSGAGLTWFTHGSAGLIAASLVIAAALAAAAVPSRESPRASVIADITAAIGPSDIVGQSLAELAQPPAIGALLLDSPGRDAR